jgi:tetratricopeptide (TPR) repeat protein
MVNNGGSLASAETEVLKLEGTDRTVEFYKMLAELKKNRGNIGEAIKTLLEGVSVYPESWDLISRCGEYQNQSGDYESAIHSLEKALTLCTDRNFSLTIERFLTELRNLHGRSDKAKSAA